MTKVNQINYWWKKFLAEKAKKERLIELGDAMYNAAQRMTTDASHLKRAMDDWWNYTNKEL